MVRDADTGGSPCQGLTKEIRTKFEQYYFSPSHGATVGGRLARLLLHCCLDFIPFIFHLSVNASSIFHLDQKLSVHFLCYNTEITVRRVPRITTRGVRLFKCFRDGSWLFRKAPRWALPTNTAGSCWLDKAGAFSPFLLYYLCQN